MSTPASIAKHPIHPMLIAFPIGLWIFSFICLLVFWRGGAEAWETAAIYSMGGGIFGALAAAIPGLIDLLDIPPSRARTKGIWHGVINVVALVIFTAAFFLRGGMTTTQFVLLSAVGVLLLFVSGWLGGSMVYVHGVGVEFKGKDERRQRMDQQKDQPGEPASEQQKQTRQREPVEV
ncbi:MAG: DUF2231 domain-containing protein [Planctomycetaceae bacterium]|nr:DUF2231 domain-containing protein [Planctomycetaceae bacterium]